MNYDDYDDYDEENEDDDLTEEEQLEQDREEFVEEFFYTCLDLDIANWKCKAVYLNTHTDKMWFNHELGWPDPSYWWPDLEFLLEETGMDRKAIELELDVDTLTKEYSHILFSRGNSLDEELFTPYMDALVDCFSDAYPGDKLLGDLEKEYSKGVVKIKNETDNWNELHVDLGKIVGKKAKDNKLTFLIVFGEDMLVSNKNEFYDYYIGTGIKQGFYYFTIKDRDNVIKKIQKALTEI